MSSRPNSQDCASPGMRLLARLAAVLLVLAVVFATDSHAAPIKYTLVITPSTDPSNTVVAGTLGTLSFGWPNSPVILTFTFEGDTTNVVGFFALAPAGWTPTKRFRLREPGGHGIGHDNGRWPGRGFGTGRYPALGRNIH